MNDRKKIAPMRMSSLALLVFSALAMAVAPAPRAEAASGQILTEIKARGYLTCGFHTNGGFASSDDKGRPNGLMVDFCHAVAAAVLGDANAIRPAWLPDKPQEFAAVENHDVDIAFQTTTWTFSRELSFDIQFVTPIFYDGQGFARWSEGPSPPLQQLGEETVCVKSSTTSQLNLEDFVQQTQRPWKIRLFRTYEEALQAFLGTECSMLTTDISVLATQLAKYRHNGGNITVFSQVISREPLTPYVPGGDENWLDIVRSVIYASILAEEKGVTSANARAMQDSPDDEVRRLLGKTPELGSALGLANDWALQAIMQVGNYGEIFERNLGKGSSYRMQRGLNRLWSEGGLLYAPQFQ